MALKDRRNFFRLNQDIIFDFKPVDVHTAEQSEPNAEFDSDTAMDLIAQLKKIDREAVQSLKILNDKNRILGDYLNKLSQKIDLIARYCVFTSSPDSEPKRINLSEGGIAFSAGRSLYKGNFVVLRMIFLPSYNPVVVFAKVIRCEETKNEYQIAAQFHRLRDQDRQAIAKEIMKAQVKSRKREYAKETSNNEN